MEFSLHERLTWTLKIKPHPTHFQTVRNKNIGLREAEGKTQEVADRTKDPGNASRQDI